MKFFKDKRWGSFGYFTMPGSRFNDYWIEGSTDLWHQFGMFIHLADGTEIAQWFHEEAVPGAEPVIWIGSEGGLNVIAPNLKTFFLDCVAHIPRGAPEYDYYNLQIYVAGLRIELLPNALPPDYKERAPLPERDTLIPLILAAREARAAGIHAVRGLWHSASLRISPNGFVWMPADWDAKPDFESGGPITANEVAADLARFPRSPRWQPDWMNELLGAETKFSQII